MTDRPEPTKSSPSPPASPRRAIWVPVLVLIAFGAAGLITTLDRPAGDLTRPELTRSGDRALASRLAAAQEPLARLGASLAELGAAGRSALTHLGDAAALQADLARADTALSSATLAGTQAGDAAAEAADGIGRERIGETNRMRLDRLTAIPGAIGSLGPAWSAVRAEVDGDPAALARALTGALSETERARGAIDGAIAALD